VSTPRVWVATVEEAEIVGELLSRFRDYYGRDWPSDNAITAWVEKLIERPDTDYLLGAPHDDAPPAAVCQLRFRPSVWTASDDCWLEDLYVRDDARRAGLGAALVELALERARARGCRRVELDTSEGNAAALALYASFGFTPASKGGPGRDLFLGVRLDGDD
jgi:GNAT superfamily N-acetyltransferase